MSAGPVGLFDVREEIVARSRAGDDLDVIEHDLIDPAPVVEDEKAALWLLAWCTKRKGVTCPRSS
jgi:hypothetical protein